MSDQATTSADDAATPSPPPSREVKRQREKASRQRRTAKLELMKRQVEALECAASAMRFVSEPDEIWDEFLAPEDKRVREYLRNSIKLLDEAKKLQDEKAGLKTLLTYYEKTKRAIREMLNVVNSDGWDYKVQRWRAFARLHFYPWSIEDCQTVIDAGIQDVYRFLYGKGVLQTSGLSFMGWQDQRRIDPDTNTLHFSLYKTFRSHNMQHHMDQYWMGYHNLKVYEPLILGRGTASLDILQRVAPNISIIRYVEKYPGLDINAHFLYLVSRVETEGGFTQCLRSIECPELERATDGENDVWASNFVWFRWEVLGEKDDLTRTDYRLTIGGSLAGQNAQYASRWMGEIMITAVRGEQWATGRPLLKFTS